MQKGGGHRLEQSLRTVPSLRSKEEVLDYLRGCGLEDLENCEVVLGFVRNTTATVTLANGKKLFLKQGIDRGPTGDGALLNEGLFYFYMESRDIAQSVDYLTRCRLHDRRSDVLILDYVPTTEKLQDRINRTGRLSAKIARAIGRTLGEIHSVTGKDKSRDVLTLGRGTGSLIPQFERLEPEDVADFSPSDIEIAKLVQGDKAITEALRDLDRTWTKSCLIHGDLRMDNILIRKPSPQKPVLIDWDMCRYGDPAADLGSFMGDVARVCIDRIRPSERGTLEWTHEANRLLGRFTEGIKEFWNGYRDSAGYIVDSRSSVPLLAVAHAGVFLLNRAAARGRATGNFTAHDLMYVAVGRRLLIDPATGTREMMDISAGGAV